MRVRGGGKPNFVPWSLATRRAAIISLRRRLPGASSSQPGGGRASNPWVGGRTRPPLLLSGLAPDGVYLSRPVTRPLVSSYLAISPLPAGSNAPGGRYVSVALSLGSPPLAVNQHPALRSSDFPRPRDDVTAARDRDCLATSYPRLPPIVYHPDVTCLCGMPAHVGRDTDGPCAIMSLGPRGEASHVRPCRATLLYAADHGMS